MVRIHYTASFDIGILLHNDFGDNCCFFTKFEENIFRLVFSSLFGPPSPVETSLPEEKTVQFYSGTNGIFVDLGAGV